LSETKFFKQAKKRKVRVIDTEIKSSDVLADVAGRLEQILRQWKTDNPLGVVIITMGIGSDGHTAGIFPSIKGVDFNSEALVVSYELPTDLQALAPRITVTNTFLTQYVDIAIVYAVGSEKRPFVQRLEKENSFGLQPNFPASVVTTMRDVQVFTDQ
jgi:6-phosphogluconolactonase/glucosamine-6-phosphate isomerase/deaminase